MELFKDRYLEIALFTFSTNGMAQKICAEICTKLGGIFKSECTGISNKHLDN